MSLTQAQTLSHVEGGNCGPTETARFLRQFVPLRASCSLSVEGGREGGGKAITLRPQIPTACLARIIQGLQDIVRLVLRDQS